MVAFTKLRHATDRVCASLERSWGKVVGAEYAGAGHRVEPLEKRQLLSVNAAVSGPATVAEGDNYVLSLTASSTASTYTVNHWVISYGDGTTHTLTGDSVADLYSWNTTSSPTYAITATVQDTESGVSYSASTSLAVTVGAATPTLAVYSDSTAFVGQPYEAYDELTDGGAHTLNSMFIAWGDGTTYSDSTTPEAITNSYADDLTHTYASEGTYAITAIASSEQRARHIDGNRPGHRHPRVLRG